MTSQDRADGDGINKSARRRFIVTTILLIIIIILLLWLYCFFKREARNIRKSVDAERSVKLKNGSVRLRHISPEVLNKLNKNNAKASEKIASKLIETALASFIAPDIDPVFVTGGTSSVTVINPNSVALGTNTTGNYVATILGGTGITISGSGSENANATITLADTAVTPGAYAGADNADGSLSLPTFSVDAQGRLTAAGLSNVTVTGIANSQLANSTIGLATGSAGTDVNVSGSPVSLGGTLTLNIPDASATARGLITTGAQTLAGDKTLTGDVTLSAFPSTRDDTGTFSPV
ncbi:MAG TPA: hypothetical protein PKB15_00035, partial [Acidimicrobiia bacterium]|nr:hypothetical protein [Acidimicrobiia bacterium]